MKDALILSPHCDDVPLSLGGALLCGELGKDVQVLVVFSISQFTQFEQGTAPREQTTATRMQEEREASRIFKYSVDFLGFPEPFARPGFLHLRDIFDPSRNIHDQAIWPSVFFAIQAWLHGYEGFLIIPLACGDHIDHRIVREAALAAVQSSNRIGFYEDLPYAGRLGEEAIGARIPERLGLLRRLTLGTCTSAAEKVRGLGVYSTQLRPVDLKLVERQWQRRGGEQLWTTERQ